MFHIHVMDNSMIMVELIQPDSNCYEENEIVPCCVDTGATFTQAGDGFIRSSNILSRLEKHPVIGSVVSQTPNGQIMFAYYVNATIKIMGRSFNITILVSDDIRLDEILLGEDFLIQNGCVFDLGERRLYFQDQDV